MTHREDLVRYFEAVNGWKNLVESRLSAIEQESESATAAPSLYLAAAELVRHASVWWRAFEPPAEVASPHRQFGGLLQSQAQCLEAVAAHGPANSTSSELDSLEQVTIQLGDTYTALSRCAAAAGITLDPWDSGSDGTNVP